MYVTRLIVRFMRLFISYIAKRNFLAYKTHQTTVRVEEGATGSIESLQQRIICGKLRKKKKKMASRSLYKLPCHFQFQTNVLVARQFLKRNAIPPDTKRYLLAAPSIVFLPVRNPFAFC